MATSKTDTPREYVKLARKIWLEAEHLSDIEKSKQLYIKALELSKRVKDNDEDCCLSPEEIKNVEEKLALIYCQSNESDKANQLLHSLGYVCKLSRSVLNYTHPSNGEVSESKDDKPIQSQQQFMRPAPCVIVDDFLSERDQNKLGRIFSDINSPYWTNHAYMIEPPSPYFSYAIPVDSLTKYGFIGSLAQKIMNSIHLQAKFPTLKRAKFVEMWAHNRPHASGHQMHFDSDDEGKDGIRNPIISTILYVSSNKEEGEISGGPSLVTTQRLRDNFLAERGYLSFPKEKRMVAFDGKVLHGVVPGKGVSPVPVMNGNVEDCSRRRVTLMLAFWRKIQIRDENGPGSARPFPIGDDNVSWAKQLVEEPTSHDGNSETSPVETSPVEIDCVYETLDGDPWTKRMGMPEYDQVFQGF